MQLVIGSGPTLGQIENDSADGLFSTAFRKLDTINNGTADLGAPFHAAGAPLNPASISMVLRADGRIQGNVRGTLFMDSPNAGCTRLIVDFQDFNDTTLESRTVTECANAGSNANARSNQTTFSETFTNSSIFKIRLRLGRSVNGRFVGQVVSRTYSFGP